MIRIFQLYLHQIVLLLETISAETQYMPNTFFSPKVQSLKVLGAGKFTQFPMVFMISHGFHGYMGFPCFPWHPWFPIYTQSIMKFKPEVTYFRLDCTYHFPKRGSPLKSDHEPKNDYYFFAQILPAKTHTHSLSSNFCTKAEFQKSLWGLHTHVPPGIFFFQLRAKFERGSHFSGHT